MIRRVAAVVALLLLAGCSSLRTREASPRELAPGSNAARSAEAAQQARVAKLGLQGAACDLPAWEMTGRAALSNGREGGSGRIEWSQGKRRSTVTLSAPVTRQSWTLVVEATGARLEGVANGPLRGADGTQLLREATGWEIPVTALGCWMRGVPANPVQSGDPRTTFASDLLPLRIEQGGWTIDYAAWAMDPASGAMLPSRVNAQRGESRVRLIVDRWNAQ